MALAAKQKKPWSGLYGDRSIARERCLLVCSQVKIIDEEETDREIKVFKAAADATRLRILKLLAGGELGICEIMLALKKPQSSISHNLSILEDAGLERKKRGKMVSLQDFGWVSYGYGQPCQAAEEKMML